MRQPELRPRRHRGGDRVLARRLRHGSPGDAPAGRARRGSARPHKAPPPRRARGGTTAQNDDGPDPFAALPAAPGPVGGYRSRDDGSDPSGLPPYKAGDPGVYPIHAASGVGYGEGFAGNAHRHAPDAWLATVEYLVELGADVNQRDHNGYNAVHHAAARGDDESHNLPGRAGRRRHRRQPARPDDGRHGQRPRAARLADSRDGGPARAAGPRRTTTTACRAEEPPGLMRDTNPTARFLRTRGRRGQARAHAWRGWALLAAIPGRRHPGCGHRAGRSALDRDDGRRRRPRPGRRVPGRTAGAVRARRRGRRALAQRQSDRGVRRYLPFPHPVAACRLRALRPRPRRRSRPLRRHRPHPARRHQPHHLRAPRYAGDRQPGSRTTRSRR